jgi:hypothetical protein
MHNQSRQMVNKKNSLITLEGSKSISNNDQQQSVPCQLFDKSAKSIHTDQQINPQFQFSEDAQDLEHFPAQVDELDYEDDYLNRAQEPQPEVVQGKSMLSKTQRSIFDAGNKLRTKSAAKIARRNVVKNLTTKTPLVAATPINESKPSTPP